MKRSIQLFLPRELRGGETQSSTLKKVAFWAVHMDPSYGYQVKGTSNSELRWYREYSSLDKGVFYWRTNG
jgi:hypothetical protein